MASSEQQPHEMTEFLEYFGERERRRLIDLYFYLELDAGEVPLHLNLSKFWEQQMHWIGQDICEIRR